MSAPTPATLPMMVINNWQDWWYKQQEQTPSAAGWASESCSQLRTCQQCLYLSALSKQNSNGTVQLAAAAGGLPVAMWQPVH